MQTIRKASTHEAEILTDLAFESEAYWGYDSGFMENFRSNYSVTKEFIEQYPTFVLEEKGNVIGFYSLIPDEKETTLEYLYVAPTSIGKGYGKVLWDHMIRYCKENGLKEIVLVTSPQAKAFYTKMGAVFTGDVDSLVIKNRKIPRLVYTI